jgi:alpha-tubulin suppressor-like RCC1 family protein
MFRGFLDCSLLQSNPSLQIGGVSPRFFVKKDGSVLATGRNDPEMVPGYEWRANPELRFVRIDVGGPVKQLEAITGQVMALMQDGTVFMWGSSNHSLLGNGVAKTSKPTQIVGLDNIVQIGIGWNHGVALRSDGKVFIWGQRTYGVLGDGLDNDKEDGIPREVAGLNDVVAISVGGRTTLALRKDKTLWAWGANRGGQLGQGSTNRCIATPVRVKGLSDVKTFGAAKNDDGANAAVTADGRVWVWGANGSSMLGNGRREGVAPLPVPVKGVTGAKHVAVGLGCVVVVHTNGTVTSWGFNGFGGLGVGATGSYNTRPMKPPVSGIAMAYVSGYATFLVKTDGTLLWSGSGDGVKTGQMAKRVSRYTAVRIP